MSRFYTYNESPGNRQVPEIKKNLHDGSRLAIASESRQSTSFAVPLPATA
jgi:hypothetical protein